MKWIKFSKLLCVLRKYHLFTGLRRRVNKIGESDAERRRAIIGVLWAIRRRLRRSAADDGIGWSEHGDQFSEDVFELDSFDDDELFDSASTGETSAAVIITMNIIDDYYHNCFIKAENKAVWKTKIFKFSVWHKKKLCQDPQCCEICH